jgi:class 3 adenylate cyclase
MALTPDGARTRARATMRVSWDWWVTDIVAALGVLNKELDKRTRAIINAAEQVRGGRAEWSLVEPGAISAAGQARLSACRSTLVSHGFDADQVDRLIEHVRAVPFDVARRLRPLALARAWKADDEFVVGLCLEASRVGLLALGWDLLCPRCRGAKLRVEALHRLPKRAHCPSCNVEYGRDFARNVELSFRPERWLRELPEGEFCLQGAGATPHVIAQRRVGPGATVTLPVQLEAGGYRIRTVEPGEAIDLELRGPGDALPLVTATETGLAAGAQQPPGSLSFHNGSRRVLHVVLEDRSWASDALTGERVIAMPVFRELCPEQVLRLGDEVEIGRVALLFSDLKGSTELYERIGDSAAYAMVREHFALLSEIIREHHGVLVKTMGDAVMAAFYEPADAARAALAIAARMTAYNTAHPATRISLKLGLHAGRCIAVTTGGALDYFGGAVNLTARLEAQSEGDDIVVSTALANDPGVAAVLANLSAEPGRAMLRGFAEPVPFVRLRLSGIPTSGS